MQAEIIAVGSELLTQDRIDTNSLWLTGQLQEVGWEVVAKAVVGDQLPRLSQILAQARLRSPLVVCCGGLGPTEDDLTRAAASQASGVPLVIQEEIWQELQAKFAGLGRAIPSNNRRQAEVLLGAASLPNPRGTAPGQWLEQEGRHLILLPGPPRELKPMFLDHCRDRLRALGSGGCLLRRSLKVFGLGESALDERLAPLYPQHPEVSVTTLFTPLDLEVHLTTSAPDSAQALERLLLLENRMREQLGADCYAQGNASLAETLVALLRQRGQTLAVGEDFTGGLMLSRLSEVEGWQEVVLGGSVAAYQSAPELAQRARQSQQADWGLAVTAAFQDDHWNGTVAIAAGQEECSLSQFRLPGDRAAARSRAAQSGLDRLRRQLLD